MTSVLTQPVREDMEEPKGKSYSPRRIETMSPSGLSPAFEKEILQGYWNQRLEPNTKEDRRAKS